MPSFRPGSRLLVQAPAYDELAPRPGEVVLASHPFEDRLLIKRVDHLLEDGRVFLVGDNRRESTDSRSFGPVSPIHLIGRVTGVIDD